jgi:hypothetical protein
MNIDCCKSYVGKQIIGLLPGGAEECLYVLAINAQDYGVSSFFGWLLNGNDFITELSNYGTVYEYQNDTGSQSVYVYYTGTQPTDLDVDILGTLTLFTIRKVTDFEGGSCDLVCYQASFDYGYEYRFIDYFATAPASPKFYGGGQPIDDDPSLYNQISIFLGPQITVTSVWNGSQYVITINNAFNLGGFRLGDGAPVYTTFTALPCEIVPPTPVPLALLDAYPGAGAAYSVRKLSSTYTGAALRIRRSSDNTEQDIGFVGFDLDTTALSSFVGAGNGFVTRWYDQTGNGRHMLQTTAGLQPTIVSSGSLIIRNGNLSIYYNNTFNIYHTTSYSFSNGPISTIGVVNMDGTSAVSQFGLYHSGTFEIGRRSNDKWGFGCLSDQTVIVTTVPGVAGYSTTPQAVVNNATYLIYSNWNGNLTPVKYRRNAIAVANTANSGSTLRTGTTSMNYYKGFISEMIIYTSDQASNVSGMETNINGYYNIYP